ncbi:unnamed protein product [Protopolystoma xenopodis]|uniref:Uncharacterized protein n=1 Tax=Protopolystoma xenopodis TaxID=117903 RepID=A0A448XLM1_9PLAT|nr:unnamed protein product [Protopolystoma xenopodis]
MLGIIITTNADDFGQISRNCFSADPPTNCSNGRLTAWQFNASLGDCQTLRVCPVAEPRPADVGTGSNLQDRLAASPVASQPPIASESASGLFGAHVGGVGGVVFAEGGRSGEDPEEDAATKGAVERLGEHEWPILMTRFFGVSTPGLYATRAACQYHCLPMPPRGTQLGFITPYIKDAYPLTDFDDLEPLSDAAEISTGQTSGNIPML